jgi:uncharacterized protein with PQ loop repeat
MTREDVARKIHWRTIIWIAGLVNVVAMVPQLIQILITHDVRGLSVGMFAIYFCIQTAFALEGYFTRNRMFMVCLGLSAAVNATVITLVLRLR